MPRRIDEPIQVGYAKDGRTPGWFLWRRRKYEVREVATEWHQTGSWWQGGGERTYLRIIASNGAAYDLCYDTAGHEWRLDVLHD